MDKVVATVSSLTLSVCGTLLAQLPPDSLSLIVDLLSTECIGRLWICGDSGLCRRMRFGGVRKFRKDMLDGVFHLRWPSLVSNFSQLVEFQMSCPVSCMRKPRPRFETLPRGLQVLELGQGFVRRFLDLDTSLLPHLVSLRLPDTCALTRFEVKNLPPRLHELCIALDSTDCLLSLSALACAPSLVSLSLTIGLFLRNMHISLEHMPILEKLVIEVGAEMLSLPKSLTSLRSVHTINLSFPLPPGLVSLSARFPNGVPPEIFDGTALPRSLTEFNWWMVGSPAPILLHSEDALRMFPSKLTKLRIPYKPHGVCFSADFCASLAHLKTLALDFGLGEESYSWRHQYALDRDPSNDKHVRRPILPDSLTDVAIGGRNDDALPLVWPKSLTSLKLGSFSIRRSSGNVGINTSNRDNGDANSSSGEVHEKHFAETGTRIAWPPSLAHLTARIVELRISDPVTGPETQRTLQDLIEEREQRLESVLVVPKTLVSLHMNSPTSHLPINSVLPPKLRTLSLHIHSNEGRIITLPSGWSTLLPDTITDLKIIGPSSFHRIDDEWFKLLKLPHLTSLHVHRHVPADPKALQFIDSPLLATLIISFGDTSGALPWAEMNLLKFKKLEKMEITSKATSTYPKNFLELIPSSVKSVAFGGTVLSNVPLEIIEKCRSQHISFAFSGNY